jgi:hypothetical protein
MDYLDKVRKLIAQAEHPNTDPIEADRFRQAADELMIKFAIDQRLLDEQRPAAYRAKPITVDIQLSDNSDILPYVAQLASDLARHCRCKIRNYSEWKNGQYWSRVYGFESDARYFEVLYTTLRLHMLGALLPSIDSDQSLDENCLRLHKAGYNWLEIASVYGWRKITRYRAQTILGWDGTVSIPDIPFAHNDGRIEPHTKVGSFYKRACHRAAKARGEAVTIISAGGSATYRRSAAWGYVSRLAQRLRKLETGRDVSEAGAIVLRSADSDLMDFFKAANPDLFQTTHQEECEACKKAKSGTCRAHRERKYTPPPFSDAGYTAGVQQANTANLDTRGSHSTSSSSTGAIDG